VTREAADVLWLAHVTRAQSHAQEPRVLAASGLLWTTAKPNTRSLRQHGFHTLHFRSLQQEFIEPARQRSSERTSLDVSGAALLDLIADNHRMAVLHTPVRTVGDLRDVYGYLVEPTFRRYGTLLIHAEERLEDLQDEDFVDPEFGYAWTLQRLRFVAERYGRTVSPESRQPPLTPIEAILYHAMRDEGLTPRAQFGIGPFRADFAFADRRLVVECDGRAWHDAARDKRRDARLREMGWEVLRITGSDIVRTPTECARKVADVLTTLMPAITYSEPNDRGTREDSWWRRLLARVFGRPRVDAPPEVEGHVSDHSPALAVGGLDVEQSAAVQGHEGVVQVIAPAGSGKTRVIVARVQELLSRGVPANRILCTTFNTAAVEELATRLSTEGVQGLTVKSFHGVGRMVLKEQGLLRPELRTATYAQWRRLAKKAMDDVRGEWIDAPDAKEAISDIKLGQMLLPDEALRRARTTEQRTVARLYELYEEMLREQNSLDYDDLILRSVRLLREDASVRTKWQGRWEFVLVDEYQDIEPAQELLVRILAAPEDGLFLVGDEDQCIYAWRRAKVERIIEVDLAYPGVERFVLKRNYRSGADIVRASAALIGENKRRFPKSIIAAQSQPGDVSVAAQESLQTAAELAVDHLVTRPREEIVLLARTSTLLRVVALACARRKLLFKAPPKVIEISGVERTLLAYTRLFAQPREAREQDVVEVFRVPNRYLPEGGRKAVASGLRAGTGFADILRGIQCEDWRWKKLSEAGEFFDQLLDRGRAVDFMKTVRSDGGLDKHFSDQEQMSAHDKDSIDALDLAEQRAIGLSLFEFAAALEEESEVLGRFASEEGVELATIHGAKGRQWAEVVLFDASEGSLPHARSLSEAATEADRSEALEGERRLAYVAFTRAQESLAVLYVREPSRFLAEAGINAVARSQPHRRPTTTETGERSPSSDSAPRRPSDDLWRHIVASGTCFSTDSPPRLVDGSYAGVLRSAKADANRAGCPVTITAQHKGFWYLIDVAYPSDHSS